MDFQMLTVDYGGLSTFSFLPSRIITILKYFNSISTQFHSDSNGFINSIECNSK